MSEDDDNDDLSIDAVREHSTGDRGTQEEPVDKFDFDVALLFSSHLADEDLAEKIQGEMSQVELKDGKKLRVCLYNDPTFGGSIIERPRNVVRRCRFVFVVVTEHTHTDSHATFTKNESLGHILAGEPPERRHCVRPLFIQEHQKCSYNIPDGLTDVDPVPWYDAHSTLCQKKLVKLIDHDIAFGSACDMRTSHPTFVTKKDTDTLEDLDVDAIVETPLQGGGSSRRDERRSGLQESVCESGDRDYVQGQSSGSMKKDTKDHHQSVDVSYNETSGSKYQVKIEGTVKNLMVGRGQTMNVFNEGKSKSKSRKVNKVPVTTSTEIPKREAMELVSSHIGKEWKKLGRDLSLSDGELDTVRLSYHAEGQEEVVYQMLRRWNTASYPTTMAQLAQACVNIGRGDVSDRLTTLTQSKH